MPKVNTALQEIREATVDHDAATVVEKYFEHGTLFYNFLRKFATFLATKCSENDTLKFLNNYCEMVEVLLNSIRADREGDYDLHLKTTRQMLPYFFTMNHNNYRTLVG